MAIVTKHPRAHQRPFLSGSRAPHSVLAPAGRTSPTKDRVMVTTPGPMVSLRGSGPGPRVVPDPVKREQPERWLGHDTPTCAARHDLPR